MAAYAPSATAVLSQGFPKVNIQVPGLGIAPSNHGLRSCVGRDVVVVRERGLRDDCTL